MPPADDISPPSRLLRLGMDLQNFRLIAAPHTPMYADGSLNLAVVRHQARHLVSTGVRGAFIAGSTGEGQSLTIEERELLVEAWIGTEVRHDLELIVHVGHNCARDACHLASHAASTGADAVSMHAPACYKPQSVAALIDFCEPVAAVAPALPFYLYDIPNITGVELSSSQFLAEGKPRIPNLAGVKYTNPDLLEVQECLQVDNGANDILWGCDEALLAGIAFGATGAVGSTYNFAAPLYQRIIAAVEASDWKTARAEQALAVKMVRLLQSFGSTPAAIKFAMKMIGIDCGPLRPPLVNLTTAQESELRAALEELGFSSHITVDESTAA